MKRRSFIRASGLATAGFTLGLSSWISSCKKTDALTKLSFSGKIGIIGGGAAGIYAAYLLDHYGIDYILLEANASLGGRLGKNESFADFPIDTGAQWLHGANNLVGDWTKNQNIPMTLDDTNISYWFSNQITSTLPKDPYIFEDQGLEDISFIDLAHKEGFGTEYDWIIENIAGDQGASANELSAYWNARDERNWSSGEDDYKFEQTYFDVFKPMITKIASNSFCNKPVVSIDYSGSKVTITTEDGTDYLVDKVLLTVPITQLKKESILFNPVLPTAKKEAISKIGMGPGMKVFLKFSEQFYADNIVGGPICAAYANEKIGKSGNDSVLLAFIMGKQAAYLTSLASDSEIIDALLNELELMYPGKALATFQNGIVFDWTKHPYVEGAYSFSTVNMGEARETLAESVENKLFFAGEAANTNGHHQTVFGAVETAYRELLNILQA